MCKFLKVLCLLVSFSFLKAQVPVSFTLHITSASSLITCSNTAVEVFAISAEQQVNYTWAGPLSTLSGQQVNLTTPGNYTVTATAPGFSSSTQVVSVGINTTVPTTGLNTLQLSMACNSVPGSLSALSNPAGVEHRFYSPAGGCYIINNQSASYTPGAPGIHTLQVVNPANGCKTTKTFTVTGSFGFPSATLYSSQNFSLGCETKTMTTVSINNAFGQGGAPVSYTLLTSSSGAVVTASILSNNNSYSVTTPGSYTAITRDNQTYCELRIPFTVTQNILQPVVKVLVPRQTLDCVKPPIKLLAASPSKSMSYVWGFTSLPTIQTGTVLVVDSTITKTNPVVNNFSLYALDYNTGCRSTTVIPTFKNFFKPVAAFGGPNTLTCAQPSLVLSNQSTTGIPPATGFSTVLPVTSAWNINGIQSPVLSGALNVSVSATYTLTATDNNNGCSTKTVIPVFDGRIHPPVNQPNAPVPFCINTLTTSVLIYPYISDPANSFQYQWQAPSQAIVTGAGTPSLTANVTGIYTVVVTNPSNGCSSTGYVIMDDCITGLLKNTYPKAGVSVYPNPCRGSFTIDTDTYPGKIRARIYNAAGQCIKEQLLAAGETTFDLYNEEAGLYSIHIVYEHGTSSLIKLIKE